MNGEMKKEKYERMYIVGYILCEIEGEIRMHVLGSVYEVHVYFCKKERSRKEKSQINEKCYFYMLDSIGEGIGMVV